MKEYVLVKSSYDYADEFNVYGFVACEKAEFNSMVDKLKTAFDERGCVEVYFGTNEYLEFSSVDEVINSLKVKDITEEEFNMFRKYFGDNYIKKPTAMFGGITFIQVYERIMNY